MQKVMLNDMWMLFFPTFKKKEEIFDKYSQHMLLKTKYSSMFYMTSACSDRENSGGSRVRKGSGILF